jgi:hypothetical protein
LVAYINNYLKPKILYCKICITHLVGHLTAYLRNEAPSQYLSSILRAQNEDLQAREALHSVSCAVPLRHCQPHHSHRQENYMKTVFTSVLFLHKIHLTVFWGSEKGENV